MSSALLLVVVDAGDAVWEATRSCGRVPVGSGKGHSPLPRKVDFSLNKCMVAVHDYVQSE